MADNGKKRGKSRDEARKAKAQTESVAQPNVDSETAVNDESAAEQKANTKTGRKSDATAERKTEGKTDKKAEPRQSESEAEANEPRLGGGADTNGEDSPEEDSRRRFLLRRFWQSAGGYWRRGGDRAAWLLTIGLLLNVLLSLGVTYGVNLWNRWFFDALEKRDAAQVINLTMIYFPLLAISVFFGASAIYGRMTMERRWRFWTTQHLLDRWLANGRYYQLNLVKGDHANPEYRVAEDLRVATESPVEFAFGIITALLSALTFIAVLWTIGGSLSFSIGGLAITIPGFLVVAAVAYALLASGAMVLIGRKFIRVSENKNQAEAEYRYALTRIRENGESIALIRGEEEERGALDSSLRNVLRRWKAVCTQTVRTTIVSQTSGFIAPVIPILLCAPKFLDGSMSLGQVMQAASAFTTVQMAFNWLVDNYPKLADWTASARRVASLMVSLDALKKAEEGDGVDRITIGENDESALRLRNLSVTLDDGTSVVNDADVSIMPGEKVLVVGESGTGKSSLVRAIAGLWPWGEGEVQIKKGAKMFMLPQRPYIPLGTLRRSATYPEAPEEIDPETVAKALKAVGLGRFVARMDEDTNWDQTLSGGEKQRLAFARLLIAKPDIIVMDEATSALDPISQKELMELVDKELHATTIISVGHRPELEAFHERKLVLEARKGGARLARDVDLVPKSQRRKWRLPLRRRGKSAKPRAA